MFRNHQKRNFNFKKNYRQNIYKRFLKNLFTKSVCGLLIVNMLSISSPAAPQIIHENINQLHQNITIGLNTGNLVNVFQNSYKFISNQSTPYQETQGNRDSQVVRIETNFPSKVTVGRQIQLGAIPYDTNNIPVSGVKIDWKIEDPNGEIQSSSTGLFTGEIIGQYNITATGAGKQQTSIISVSEPPSFSYKSSESNNDNSLDQPNLLPIEGWNQDNIEQARNTRNQRGDSPGKPKINTNFNIIAPILAITGRAGMDLNLNLIYNSRVWTKTGQDISFDIDKDNISAGWTVGFGKILNFVDGGIVQVNEDGSKRFFAGAIKTESNPNIKVFEGQSTDGSFIKAQGRTSGYVMANGVCYSSSNVTLKYPDGTVIAYANSYEDSAYQCRPAGTPIPLTPTYIGDKHRNGISIYYYGDEWNAAPAGKTINVVCDSLGRYYTFNYTLINGRYYITSITGPGLKDENGSVTQRTFARLNYKDLTLSYNFSGLNPKVRDNNNSIKVLSSIYYPATNTGYWFNDSDSYSPYGMIRKVEEQKGMSFDSSTGIISAGQVTRRRIYSYPGDTSASINDVPEYPSVTETWDGMPNSNSPAITTYNTDLDSNPRTTTITLPYQQGKTIEYSYNYTNSNDTDEKAKDGVTFKTEFYDGNNILRTKDETNWDVGHLSFSAHNNASTYSLNILRPNSVTHTEIENGNTLIKKSIFDSYGAYNRVLEMHEVGYNGETLRKIKTQYASDIDDDGFGLYDRIINLPKIIETFDANNNRIDYTEYRYDVMPVKLACTEPPCTAELSEAKGNLSNVVKYGKVTNSSLEEQHIDARIYDNRGNIVSYSPSATGVNQIHMTFAYATTNWGFPEELTRGNDSSPNSKTSSFSTYDYNTGLPLTITDANQKTVTLQYDLQTWRLKKTTSPTGAYTINDFDDLNRIYTQTDYTSTGEVVGKQVNKVNGLNLPYRQESLSGSNQQDGNIWDVTEIKYDNLGRTKKTSNPFKSTESTNGVYWSEVFYDWAGRVEKTIKPDGSEKFNYYNEAARPQGASAGLGQTFRTKDPIGREKWYRTDSDGNIVEVIEPTPDGNGSVSTNGFLTKYEYDRLGQLIRTEQGAQERKFKYDSLGHLTHQKLAETKATLDADGNFVGEATGQWSDFFKYDEMSNISSSTNALGVKTLYSYINPSQGGSIDPLNRLFEIRYETNGAANVLPSPTVKYTYRSSGDVSQIESIYTENNNNGNAERVITYDLGYDTYGRISEKKTTLASKPNLPFKINYTYDSLSRITDVQYPMQYINGSDTTRKNIHNDYDIAGRTNGLKVDNVNYASDFVFNAADQITSVKIGPSGANQINEKYDYNPQTGLLENQKVLRGSATLLDLSYQYQQCSCSSGSGQITGIINNLDRNKDRLYEYDKIGRLKKVTGGLNRTWSQTYTYDRYGNRTNVANLGVESLRAATEKSDNGESKIGEIKGITAVNPNAARDKIVNDLKNLEKNKTLSDSSELKEESVQSEHQELAKTDFYSNGDQENSDVNLKGNVQITPQIDSENSTATTPGTPFDFDGDGKADYSAWRRTNGSLSAGTWLIRNSQSGQNSTIQLGSGGNQIAPGDYDGDGKTDEAVWNPSNGAWTIKNSLNGTTVIKYWGGKGDAIVPADYDGDGKTDLAVWRPSTGYWYILKSSDNTNYGVQFGAQQFGDIPTNSDYDGDGKTDLAVWRPSNGYWYMYILQSSTYQFVQLQWGQYGDVPVIADYDGDHKSDFAVWRPSDSAWYILQSSNWQFIAHSLGAESSRDICVPADYDGDGKADPAAWTPSTGTWKVKQSTTGSITTFQLGTKDDIAVPSAYIRRSSAPNNQSSEIPRDGFESLSFDPTSNRITTTGFEYDFAGNQTRIVKPDGSVQRFQYDAAGRLIKVKNDNQQTVATFTYGIGRQRLVSQDGDENSTYKTYYAWEGGAVVSEYIDGANNSYTWTKNYIYMGGALLATQQQTVNGETVQFDHPDQLGTRIITDPGNGTFSEQNTLPFGTALESETTGAISRRFTSYDRNSSSGLDYAVNRFYDSGQGRFTTVDPIKTKSVKILNPQTLNMYAYCANDPINHTDPDGLDGFPSFGSTTWGGWGFGLPGASGNSFMTGLGLFLNGFLGNLFGGGRSYAGAIFAGMPLNTGTMIISAPPPLPGAGTISQVSSMQGSTGLSPCMRNLLGSEFSSINVGNKTYNAVNDAKFIQGIPGIITTFNKDAWASTLGLYDIHYDPNKLKITGGGSWDQIRVIAEELAHVDQFLSLWQDSFNRRKNEAKGTQVKVDVSYDDAKKGWAGAYLGESALIVGRNAARYVAPIPGLLFSRKDPYYDNKYEVAAQTRANDIVKKLQQQGKTPCQ